MIVDTHAHLMFKDFRGEVKEVIERAKSVGVERIINVGCNKQTSREAVEMLDRHEGLFATLGLHPYDSLECGDDLMEEWAELILKNKKIVAIGECGLDYFKAKVGKEDQKRAFIAQLGLAKKTGLPVIIHNREADEDCFEILEEFEKENGKVEVVFHCFGSDVEFARRCWYKGYYTSFTGVITYPTAQKLRDVVREAPMNLFMVETDCPFLAPQKYRGGRNEPVYVVEVVKEVAEIKGLRVDEVEKASTENAEEFFLRID
ncbi:MAG: TatD family hydrolase [Candidatus Peregrinibacteria bacterium]